MKVLRICWLAVVVLFTTITMVLAEESLDSEAVTVYKEHTIVAYFNEEGNPVDSREGSTYYRKIIKINGNNSYVIQDFYTKTDKKQIDPVLFTNIKNMYSFISDEIGEKEGPYVQWYENGQKEFETFYKNNIPVHAEKIWYPNGQLQSEINLVNNKFSGPQRTWYENGKQKYYFEIINEKENKAKLIEWYENGQKKLEQSINGQAYSLKEWYETGKKKSDGSYNKDGEKEDIYKEWYPNGRLQSECDYKDNTPTGCKLWNEQGLLISE